MPHKRAKRSVREHLRSQTGTDLPPPKSSIVKKGSKGDIANEAIPKSLARVLNAAKVREDFKEKKRKNGFDEDDEQGGGGKRRKVNGKEGKTKDRNGVSGILPGESLQHYNKRVEASMRPLVRSAVQTSLAVSRNADKKQLEEIEGKKRQRKEAQAQQQQRKTKKTGRGADSGSSDDDYDDAETPHRPEHKPKSRVTDFETYSTSAPRRLNDIAQAPPQLKPLKARGGSRSGPDGLSTGKANAATGTGKKHEGVLSMAQKQMMEVEREKAVKRYRELKAQREAEKERQRDGGTES
ncbi:hypothetical protein D9758_013067 [Tetrapyrgos nigripes]|uniref:Uncharacterized protein n=1 Tax=Tetrapyrgos nigripes TaxID=182062 RepID=A0A8H5FR64_9AGAR|nr:hypothetical protein D9758_013067 [Tetrapyrgos nigripes]